MRDFFRGPNATVRSQCLYRREYPAKAYIDATKVQKNKHPNMCQQQATCWTRYELDTSALVQNDNCDSSSYTKLPSNMCKQTWAPTEYDEVRWWIHSESVWMI